MSAYVGRLNPGRVEIRHDEHGVVLVDSREPDKALLRFTNDEWLDFATDAFLTVRSRIQLQPESRH